MNRFLYTSSCLSLFLIPIISSAQENLTTILERGYSAQWFVCGPFESDLDQGIIEAVANAQVPLGRNDFMASRGGTKNVQPAHGLEVDKEDGIAIWLRTRAEDSVVDFSPFFKQADSGIAFAAFYADTPNEQSDVLSPLRPKDRRVDLQHGLAPSRSRNLHTRQCANRRRHIIHLDPRRYLCLANTRAAHN